MGTYECQIVIDFRDFQELKTDKYNLLDSYYKPIYINPPADVSRVTITPKRAARPPPVLNVA